MAERNNERKDKGDGGKIWGGKTIHNFRHKQIKEQTQVKSIQIVYYARKQNRSNGS